MAKARNLWTQKLLGRGKLKSPSINAKRRTSRVPTKSFTLRAPFEGYVLGIDPSLRGSGFAVIEFKRGEQPALRFSKTLRLKVGLPFADCLGEIYKLCSDCCNDYPIKHVALEETIYVNNFKVAQILGATRGAAIAAANIFGKPIFEYPPLRIKQAIVGFGRAPKEQVAGMTKQILGLKATLPFDESDAAAAALCHAFSFKQRIS